MKMINIEITNMFFYIKILYTGWSIHHNYNEMEIINMENNKYKITWF